MIKEIERPDFSYNIKLGIIPDDKFYYNDSTNEYYLYNNRVKGNNIYCIYFNEKGTHRESGYALFGPSVNEFYLNDIHFFPYKFAEKTNHLICIHCNNFCKQECFF